MKVAWIAISALIGFGVGYAADAVAWGSADHGLRIGLKAEPGNEVLLVYQNTGPDTLRVFFGLNAIPHISVTAISPGGKEYPVFDARALFGGSFAVKPQENVVELSPGASQETKFSMKRLICVRNRKDVTFDVLWAQHYRLRAVYKVGAQDRTSGPWWTGEIRSGELRAP